MGRLSKVHIEPTPEELYARHRTLFPPLDPREKLGVNKRFWKMLGAILRIAFPRCAPAEANARMKVADMQQHWKRSDSLGPSHLLPHHSNYSQCSRRQAGR